MDVIQLQDIVKVYRGKRRTTIAALQSMSLCVGQGEVFGFLGPNGAGKSTTIKILMGLVRPTSGSAQLMGLDAGRPQARARVGYLPENPAFYEFLTGEEYLRFVAASFGLSGELLSRRVDEVLSLMDLQEARRRPVRGYSKGMVQRLGLAQALVHDPDVLILDEPMSGLDPVGRALVKQVLLDLRACGKTVFFSTHITADVEAVCDRVGVIVKGRIEAIDRVETILARHLSGYNLKFYNAKTAAVCEVFAEIKELPDVVAKNTAAGLELLAIEPCRQSLEKFFLDIVKPA